MTDAPEYVLVPREPTTAMLRAVSAEPATWARIVEDYKRMIEAAPAPAAAVESGWQDISTAPRDGRKFLVWEPFYGIRIGRAFDRSDHDDWLSYMDAFGGSSKGGMRATHWRPLPAAPPSEQIVREERNAWPDRQAAYVALREAGMGAPAAPTPSEPAGAAGTGIPASESTAPAAEVERSDGDLLAYLSTDAAKWAAEFRTTARKLGYSDMDEGWLIGWFANAIEAGRADAIIVPAMMALARHGIRPDIQELLVHGSAREGVPPGALKAVLTAILVALAKPNTGRED